MTMHPAELNEINPCRGCAERRVGCHSACERRREWEAKWAACCEHRRRGEADRDDPHATDPHIAAALRRRGRRS